MASVDRKKGSDRPTITNENNDEVVRQLVKERPQISGRQLQQELRGWSEMFPTLM